MFVLGLDAALNRTGYALVQKLDGRERLIASGVLTKSTEVARAAFAMEYRGVDLVAIEEPFLGPNVDTLLKLAAEMGAWRHAFGVLNVAVETVKADVWQMGVLRGLIDSKTKRDGRKKQARIWARTTFQLPALPLEDVADASGLATWCARQRAMKSKIAAAQVPR